MLLETTKKLKLKILLYNEITIHLYTGMNFSANAPKDADVIDAGRESLKSTIQHLIMQINITYRSALTITLHCKQKLCGQ